MGEVGHDTVDGVTVFGEFVFVFGDESDDISFASSVSEIAHHLIVAGSADDDGVNFPSEAIRLDHYGEFFALSGV